MSSPQKISSEALQQLFSEARTVSSWLPEPVSDQSLREIYELAKWGPTSLNSCPMRIIFVKSSSEKERLLPCLSPGNVEKVKAAPVTAIVAEDRKFYDHIQKLAPQFAAFREHFVANAGLAETTAFRNSTLQGAYLILAARSLGFDCGPMSGFDNAKVDAAFFEGTSWRSNFICSIGHGDKTKLFPRAPRLTFEEACKIV